MAEVKYLRLSHCQWINRLSKQIINITKEQEEQNTKIEDLIGRVEELENKLDKNSVIFSGESDPSQELGDVGDAYLELGNGSFWKKEEGGWMQQGYISVCGEAFSK